jgi:hypothetical protein
MLKKTLLLTSALASVALISTASFAELKVSATQEWEFSSANQASNSNDNKLLGSQTDLNLSGGGDLGGGNSYTMSYAFSNAAHDTVQANLKMGGVDIELGQNGSIGVEDVKAIVPFVNNRANDVAGSGISYDVTDLSSGKSYIGANFAAGSAGAISVGYNPNMGNRKTTGTDAGIAGGTLSNGSAFTASFKGSLGVDGLTVGVGILEGSNANSVNDDVASLTYGVAYNFGSISVGAQHIENTSGTVAKTASSETIVDNYGVAFAASDSISLGLYRSDSKKEVEGVAGNKMESTILQIGYKLGAAKVSYDYVTSDNYAHSATNDVTLHKVKLMMAF